MYSAVKTGAMIVHQAFHPGENVCKNILREVLGVDWEDKMNEDKEARQLQKKLQEFVTNDVMDTGSLPTFSGTSVPTLVYAHGLTPRTCIIVTIMERLLKEDEEHLGTLHDANDEGSCTSSVKFHPRTYSF